MVPSSPSPSAHKPTALNIVEVGPRDGLQNEPLSLDAKTRAELVTRLTQAGLREIEVGAFVSPKAVPQMAHSDEVLRLLKQNDAHHHVLVPNLKGLKAARSAGATHIAIFTAASDGFSQANVNTDIEGSLAALKPVAEKAKAQGLRLRGYVSCVLGCPYEGAVDPAKVVRVSRALYDMGCTEISLGDTIGVGTPLETKALIKAVADVVPMSMLAGHFHNTYGQALANIFAAFELGVKSFDASIAGLGGCPFAPGASGNVATQDVAYAFEHSGVDTGLNMAQLLETSSWICKKLGQQNRAGVQGLRPF